MKCILCNDMRQVKLYGISFLQKIRLKDEKSLIRKKAIVYLLVRENECTIMEVRTEEEILYVTYEKIDSNMYVTRTRLL